MPSGLEGCEEEEEALAAAGEIKMGLELNEGGLGRDVSSCGRGIEHVGYQGRIGCEDHGDGLQ